MRFRRLSFVALIVLFSTPSSFAAGKPWALSARVGGLSDMGPGPEFDAGFGASVAIERRAGRLLALRATAGFARSEGRGRGVGGSDFDRFTYAADVVFRRASGVLSPSVFAGVGATTVSQRVPVRDDVFRSNFTEPSLRVGAGLSRRVGPNLAIELEGTATTYSFQGFGFPGERQWEASWTAGLRWEWGGSAVR